MSYLDSLRGLKFKVRKVESAGVEFYLRELSGRVRLEFEGEQDLERRLLKMIHASLCDPDGNPTENPEDFDAFMAAVPNSVLRDLTREFSALNLTKESEIKN